METHGRYLNVVDVEATCWSGKQPADQVPEIIEIGLTVLDLHERVRVAKHQIMVRPQRSTVSAFCTELTGLTQEQVDSGVTFAQACDQLRREHHTDSRAWASWGDYDRKQFRRQCDATGVRYPFGSVHTNAKQQFAVAHGWPKGVGMHQALAVAQLPLEGRHHCGADDAWNIAALILHMMERGAWPGDKANAATAAAAAE